jgi:hypothetical protein
LALDMYVLINTILKQMHGDQAAVVVLFILSIICNSLVFLSK